MATKEEIAKSQTATTGGRKKKKIGRGDGFSLNPIREI